MGGRKWSESARYPFADHPWWTIVVTHVYKRYLPARAHSRARARLVFTATCWSIAICRRAEHACAWRIHVCVYSPGQKSLGEPQRSNTADDDRRRVFSRKLPAHRGKWNRTSFFPSTTCPPFHPPTTTPRRFLSIFFLNRKRVRSRPFVEDGVAGEAAAIYVASKE